MKILHVISSVSPRGGGPSKLIFELCQALAKKGHQVTIFTTNIDGSEDLDVPLNKPCHRDGVTLKYFQVNIPRFWKLSWPLKNALKNECKNFDIVHIHSLYLFPTLIASYYCKKYEIPYLIQPHGVLDPFLLRRHPMRKKIYTQLIEKRNLKKASRIQCTSEEEKILVQNYLASIGVKNRCVIAPCGINFEEYKNLPEKGIFRKKYQQLKNKKIILFLGRINFKKGLDILIWSLKSVIEKEGDAHLVIVGPDEANYSIKVREWIKEEGVEEHVTFTGMLLGSEKLAAFQDADLFVLSSYTENFGISIIEAMACGLPVIISNKVNIYDEIEKHNAGIVIDCDSSQLSSAIVSLLQQPCLREKMGNLGKAMVREKYAWDKIAESMIGSYDEIIKENKKVDCE